MNFLCDEMLHALGRWLRAAGYDVVIAAQARPDHEILAQAIDEDRVLLTRDRSFPAAPTANSGQVLLLKSNGLEANVRELMQIIPVNWLLAPFTRCLECNTPLVAADHSAMARIPQEFRAVPGGNYYCPRCDKVYWNGGHAARMRQRLAGWQKVRT